MGVEGTLHRSGSEEKEETENSSMDELVNFPFSIKWKNEEEDASGRCRDAFKTPWEVKVYTSSPHEQASGYVQEVS